MFTKTTPEKVGVSSRKVLDFVRTLDASGLATHDLILARGNEIFAEGYWSPFTADFKHRQYSVSKSFISIAVGFMIQDGKMHLDDKLADFFPEYVEGNPVINQHLLDTTVHDLLTMQTCHTSTPQWIEGGVKDRLSLYFATPADKVPGTTFLYDSPGSFMLCAAVERLAGKPFLEYLKEKVLLDLGFSADTACIQAPGGHSFGDSGILCTARELLAFARFVLNGGTWAGKRYLNEDYIKRATARQCDNNPQGTKTFDGYGYGYLIWKAPRNGFAFIGMGDQFAICDPETDIICIVHSDNQGKSAYTREVLFCKLYENIIDLAKDPLPEDTKAYEELEAYLSSRKLLCVKENADNPFKTEIDGVTYALEPNPMGMKWVRFDFEGQKGSLSYENAQGEKTLLFGLGENVFSKFPQTGYSLWTASVPEAGNRYDCAASADWPEPQKLRIKVQAIDKYFGNLNMTFRFKGDEVAILMEKNAEAFFNEYQGNACGKKVSE